MAILPILVSSDLDASICLYEALGFTVLMVIEGPDGRAWMASLEEPFGGGQLMISDADGFLGDAPNHAFLFLDIDEDQDLEALLARYREAGVEVVRDIQTEWAGIRVFEFRDGNGHTWRAAQRVGPFDVSRLPQGCRVR